MVIPAGTGTGTKTSNTGRYPGSAGIPADPWLLYTFEVRFRPYFPRRSRLKFGQYAPNGCVVTILVTIGTKVKSNEAAA